ncbi:MAG: 26S proteasome non-ATPase regulatory subunit 9 [Stictis urceolatum]|nr:26S proteasome non-ATPase regulatory subunit 9 [Stictis urceolata]
MEDIHTPSVASGQANGQRLAEDKGQKSLLDLISEKENIESEMGALSSVLDSHGVNMNTSLTSFDGYPRDDIDIAQSM